MISAIVLVRDGRASDDPSVAREIVVRSLAWLVSAVVAGVVGDVTLAGPAGLGLDDVADRTGCKVVEADDEVGRLAPAVAGARNARLLVVRAGHHLDAALLAEIDAFDRRAEPAAGAVILAAPETLLERIVPRRAAVVGVLTQRDRAGAGSFGDLVRRAGKVTRLRARATRVR